MRRRSPSEEQACNTQCAARQNSAPCQGGVLQQAQMGGCRSLVQS